MYRQSSNRESNSHIYIYIHLAGLSAKTEAGGGRWEVGGGNQVSTYGALCSASVPRYIGSLE